MGIWILCVYHLVLEMYHLADLKVLESPFIILLLIVVSHPCSPPLPNHLPVHRHRDID